MTSKSDGDVRDVRLNDNSIVNVTSNHLTHDPLHEVGRRVKNTSNVIIKQSDLIHSCSNGIGGIDLMDQLLSYRLKIPGQKIVRVVAIICQLSEPHCRLHLAPAL